MRLKGPAGALVDEVRSGASYLSQSDLKLHFGLGSMTAPPTLEIRWPSGATQTIHPEGINRVVVVVEGGGLEGGGVESGP